MEDELDTAINYNKSIFLTFDFDWANDDVLNATLDILEDNDVGATFFVTHQTSVLDRIRQNRKMELGIHPNFKKHLFGEERRHFSQIIDEILAIVPESVSTRSHCLTQSSTISLELKRRGLLYDLNVYVPPTAEILLKPFLNPFGLMTVPFFFEDDLYFFMEEHKKTVESYFEQSSNLGGIKVFNFHPTLIFLNADTLDLRERARPSFHDTAKLKQLRNKKTFGTMDFLMNTIEYGKKHSYNFLKINQVCVST